MRDHDSVCNMLRARLDQMKADGEDTSEPESAYMQTLYQLRDASQQRIRDLGLIRVSLSRHGQLL